MSESFSEEEARQIFARASERQHAVAGRGEGLSLTELQAIGREAGLDPAHIAAAVADLRSGPTPEPTVVAGIDLTPRRVRVLPVELSDDLWEEMVARLRRTFGAKGVPSEVGRIREWTSGPTSNLHVVAEPVEGGTRVTIESSRADEARAPSTLGVGGVALAAFFLVLGFAGDKLFDPVMWVFVGLFLVLGAVGALASRGGLSRWSARRTGEFDALMDQFDLLARTVATAPERPRLDLDALPDPETAGRSPSSRIRRRS
jgi:hypothetical protein